MANTRNGVCHFPPGKMDLADELDGLDHGYYSD